MTSLAYARDADVLVTRSQDGSIVVRDPETFAEIRRIEGGTSSTAEGIAVGPHISLDGELLLTVRDQIPRLWHVPTGTLLGDFPHDEGALAFGYQGLDHMQLATIFGEHALIWNLDVDSWDDIACRAAGRNLTRSEWEQFGPADQDYQVTCPQWPTGR